MRRLMIVGVAVLALVGCEKSGMVGDEPDRVDQFAANYPTVGTGGTDMTAELWVKPAVAAGADAPCTADGDTALRSASTHNYAYPDQPTVPVFRIMSSRWVIGLAWDGDVWFTVGEGGLEIPDNPETVPQPVCTTLAGNGVRDGQWHHIAVTRRLDGSVRIWVDGKLAAEGALRAGDLSKPDPQGGNVEVQVGGTEINDGVIWEFGPPDLYSGSVDEVRLSSTRRYTSTTFTVPTTHFTTDALTDRLWHFDGTLTAASGRQYVPDSSENPKGLGALYVQDNNGSQPLSYDSPFA